MIHESLVWHDALVAKTSPLNRWRKRTRALGTMAVPHQKLGATWVPTKGTNFAVWSSRAHKVWVCLWDREEGEKRYEMTRHIAGATPGHPHIWSTFIPDVGPGQYYGFRADGPWDPEHGHRFNVDKLLTDPYAYALVGGYDPDITLGSVPSDDLRRDDRDSAGHIPWSVVVDHDFDWGDDQPLRTPMAASVIYETHVKGLTKLHPQVPEKQRGTFAGLSHPAVVEYLTTLGITAVELLPVHAFLSEPFLLQQGLTNYWGYNTLGFFAPHAAYCSGTDPQEQLREFKSMVKTLHEAGLEVILDVVYNHTAEGGVGGPTLCWKGLDNEEYYRLNNGNRQHYANLTGCGNALDLSKVQVLTMVMDSLRYWVENMHVDGFRFDLASTLGRTDAGHFDTQSSSFFAALRQDPVLAHTKLIAEPWDVGAGGYQVGAFPVPYAEWNDSYRDTTRDFWLTQQAPIHIMGASLAGSSDRFGRRGPLASINYVSSHDGFTMADLVSYNEKHNDANGENNRDGDSHNRSRNHGAEGPTDDPGINTQRFQQHANLLATLCMSLGVPMILGGDESGRTQQGNNNSYCQDNETSWYNWNFTEDQRALLALTQELIALRQRHPELHVSTHWTGRAPSSSGMKDVTWYGSSGEEIAWPNPGDSLGMLVAPLVEQGNSDQSAAGLYSFFHRGDHAVELTLPSNSSRVAYELEFNTVGPAVIDSGHPISTSVVFHPGETFRVMPHSVVVFGVKKREYSP